VSRSRICRSVYPLLHMSSCGWSRLSSGPCWVEQSNFILSWNLAELARWSEWAFILQILTGKKKPKNRTIPNKKWSQHGAAAWPSYRQSWDTPCRGVETQQRISGQKYLFWTASVV
jgi:hypothetical protein